MLTPDKTNNRPNQKQNEKPQVNKQEKKKKTTKTTPTNQAKKENNPKNPNPSLKPTQNSEILATSQQPFNRVIQADASQKRPYSLFISHANSNHPSLPE